MNAMNVMPVRRLFLGVEHSVCGRPWRDRLDERRAELIADAAIHEKVTPEVWGEAMAALVAAVKDGRPGDGMAEAVRHVGIVLAEHFPRADDYRNELPDRLIEL